MSLDNRLDITDDGALADAEERIGKVRAFGLYRSDLTDAFEVGTFSGLAGIHRSLFGELYGFAGEIRQVDIAKGSFPFAPARFLDSTLRSIDRMPHGTFDEIAAKYVEMNIAHPFREGNGRSMRIWLDTMLLRSLGMVVDWTSIDCERYLSAMVASPVDDAPIGKLLAGALTAEVAEPSALARRIDASFAYEGLDAYRTEDLL
ncbi:MAG: Fic family protein [Coriobacteriaceae bacterium]|nr:Fic family protein [Coriobacteriaceae bacterium]